MANATIQQNVTQELIKMMQNMSMSYITFAIAVWWLGRGSPDNVDELGEPLRRGPLPYDLLWKRFPKFVIGYLGLSAVISISRELATLY